MNNIFKDAYFGKIYKTRNNKKVIYIEDDPFDNERVYVLYEGATLIRRVMKNGHCFANNINRDNDIISEWKEEIDEERLDKIAVEEADKYCKGYGCGHIYTNDWEIAHDCIKIGYHKAKEE